MQEHSAGPRGHVAPSPWEAWLLAARPRTLTASVAPVLVGSAVGRVLDHANPSPAAAAAGDGVWWSLAALAATLFIQIGTNFVNDAADFERGTDDAARLGPMRACQMGWLRPRTVMIGAGACFLVAMSLAVPIVLRGGAPIVAIGVLSIACGYLYTAGPFPLAYLGLGEVFVVLFFGFVAVWGVAYLWSPAAAVADPAPALLGGAQVGLLAAALLAINNLRDAAGDRRSGKRTLAARFGETFGRCEIAFCLLAPFALGALWWAQGRIAAALLPVLAMPGMYVVAAGTWREPPTARFNQYLGMTAMLQLWFAVLLSIGIAVG